MNANAKNRTVMAELVAALRKKDTKLIDKKKKELKKHIIATFKV